MTLPTPDPSADEPPIRRSRLANGLILTLAGTLVVASVAILSNFLTARSRDAVVEATPIDLKTPISGILEELNVKAGVAVKAGETLGRIDDPLTSNQEVSRLTTALATAKGDLAELQEEINKQLRLNQTVQGDADAQQKLEIERGTSDLRRLETEVVRSGEEVAFAQRDLKRQEELFRAGAVAETVVDRARTDLNRERQQQAGLQQRLSGQRSVLEAARRNLTLTTTRSNFDPSVRLQESRLRLQKLEGHQHTQKERVEGLTQQLSAAKKQFNQQSEQLLTSPRKAVVWKMLANQGDSLKRDAAVLQLIDCKDRWITTYVNERDLRRLRIGSPARIDLIGDDLDLRGEVALIRSGVGRVSLGGESVLIPINLARESEVRVRILNDLPAPPLKFCYVGYTGRVLFER
ncbi:MAG: HlyD family efflux transporter periplasmic adaptor subunit [Synechococcaceae cyanobacterium ELA445]